MQQIIFSINNVHGMVMFSVRIRTLYTYSSYESGHCLLVRYWTVEFAVKVAAVPQPP